MGGLKRGGEAAQLMCNRLIDFFSPETEKVDPETLCRLLYDTNLGISEWGDNSTCRDGGGCAGTVAWFHRNRLTLFHAGDTMGILLRNGAAKYLTSDHSIGHGLLRYFGLGESLVIETTEHALEEGDVIVLATDGVIKGRTELRVREIGAFVSKAYLRSPKNAAKELCHLAERRGSQDDITSMVIEVEEFTDER
jgi:serine/threonine protein phosphatase PrpC